MGERLSVWLLLATMVAFGLGAPGCGPRQPGNETCSGFDIDVEKVWSVEIKAKVMEYGGSVGTDVVQKVATKMDTVLRDYVYLREAACRDHAAGLITKDEYKKKVACFDAFLQHQRTLVTALMEGDPNTIQSLGLGAAGEEVRECR